MLPCLAEEGKREKRDKKELKGNEYLGDRFLQFFLSAWVVNKENLLHCYGIRRISAGLIRCNHLNGASSSSNRSYFPCAVNSRNICVVRFETNCRECSAGREDMDVVIGISLFFVQRHRGGRIIECEQVFAWSGRSIWMALCSRSRLHCHQLPSYRDTFHLFRRGG